MPFQQNQHRSVVVRKNCLKFLAALAKYRYGLEYESSLSIKYEWQQEQWKTYRSQLLAEARPRWANLNKYGLLLLAEGKKWNMTTWMESHQWFSLEKSGFFDDDSDDDKMKKFLNDYPADSAAWGFSLQQTLLWCQTTKVPFGFSGYEVENDDDDMREWLISDVERDVGILLIVANERSFGKDGQVVPPPLTPRERAVLNVIPFLADGSITGAKILHKLQKVLKDPATKLLSQSALTKDIIPKLKQYYGVTKIPKGIGYFRSPPA